MYKLVGCTGRMPNVYFTAYVCDSLSVWKGFFVVAQDRKGRYGLAIVGCFLLRCHWSFKWVICTIGAQLIPFAVHNSPSTHYYNAIYVWMKFRRVVW